MKLSGLLDAFSPEGRNKPNRLAVPARPNLAVARVLLPQVIELGLGGRQSCGLTSQLNALIARGLITPEQAMTAQDELVNGKRHDDYWETMPDDTQAWGPDSSDLARILGSATNTAVGLDYVESPNPDSLAERLREGYAAVVVDEDSPNGASSHTRLAFAPQETNLLFIHDPDPRRQPTTGLYEFADLARFQNGPYAIVF